MRLTADIIMVSRSIGIGSRIDVFVAETTARGEYDQPDANQTAG